MIILIKLWRITRRYGFGLLAVLILFQWLPLLVQKAGDKFGNQWGLVIGLYLGVVLTGLMYLAWRDIHSFIKSRLADA